MGLVRPQGPAAQGFAPARPVEGCARGAEGSRLIAVLDTGGVEGIAPLDEQRRARLRALREHAADLIVPAAVLAESVLTGNIGHDYHLRRLLELSDVTDVAEELGYAAGALRQEAIRAGFDPPPSGVDAIVVAEADSRAARDDVQIIASEIGRAHV